VPNGTGAGVVDVASSVVVSGRSGDLLVVLLFGLGLLTWWAIADILKRSATEWPGSGLSRWHWALVVFFVPLGAIAYLVYGPPRSLGPRTR